MMPIISWISARDRLGLWAGASTAAERAACVSDFISLGCGNQEGVPRKLAISRLLLTEQTPCRLPSVPPLPPGAMR